MLVLRSSGASPFVRKVRIAADIVGVADRIEVVDAETLNAGAGPPRTEPARQDPDARARERRHALRLARHPRIPRRARRRHAHPAGLAAVCGLAPAGARRRPDGCGRAADVRDPLAARGAPGGEMGRAPEGQGRRARSTRRNARSTPPRRRRSTSAISRSPARSAISTCASRASGATTTRSSSPGSTISQDACRRSRRRGSRAKA